MYVQTYILTNKHPQFSIVLPLRVSRSLHLLANKKKFMCLGLLQLAWTHHSLFGRSNSLFYQDDLTTYVTGDVGRMFHINKWKINK